MNNVLMLILIGMVEAVVYLIRYRSANERSPWVSAASTFAICVTRILFVLIGASAVIAGTHWVAAILAYAIPATVVTGVQHEYLERRKERSNELS